MKFIYSILFLFLFVEVNAQPKTLYGLKTSKLISINYSGFKSFYMDETPVTYADFKKYVRAGGEKTAYWYYESYNVNEQPVTGISWHQAADYCNWRSKCEGLEPIYFVTDQFDSYGYPIYGRDTLANGYRLPLWAEFFWASAGEYDYQKALTLKYAWGDSFYTDSIINDFQSNIDIDSGMKSTQWWRLAPVTSQYKNAFGLYNICGNNWHWCDEWYINEYSMYLAGGSWGSIDPENLILINRSCCSPGNYNYDIGFRCIKYSSGITDSIIQVDTTIEHVFYKSLSSNVENEIVDFYGNDFRNKLAQFLGDNYPECINFRMKVDQQEKLERISMADLIIKVCKRNNINPLFLVSVMISESGFGTVSFPRWYNNPMAYMWQNKLMEKGEPVYEARPGKRNRKYKTLEEGFEAFCVGIRRDLYYRAAKKDLDAFHLIYVGYRADEWMNTMKRIYRDIAGVRFEPKFPEGDAGKYIYADWEKIKKSIK